MKSLIRTIATLLLMAGASSAFASPVSLPVSVIKISIALPAAQFDFSDLDVRDEFNRIVSAPVLRERFEAQLNRELNRLLIENLTPLRRAWISMLDAARDTASGWLSGLKLFAVEVALAVLRGFPILFSLVQWSGYAPVVNAASGAWLAESSFLSLLLRLISSTRLLR